jgi:CspA family cold shock protein
MKRGKIDKRKEITKIRSKKTKNSITNKRIKEREPDLWKEVYSGLKLLGKKYKIFREKQKIKKQKGEQIRLKEQEEQRLKEQEQQKLQEQEERKLQKEQKLQEEEERRLKAREKQKLEEERIKEEQQEREKQECAYKERVAKGDRERLKQIEKVRQLRQEEKQLKEEREFFIKEGKLKKEERLEEEQRPKEEGKRLNGKVKWFNGAKGYGFIEREGEEKDIFVHFSAIKKSDLKYLEEGEQLTFEIKNSDKGPSAINLQKVTNLQKAPVLKLVKKN